MLYYGESDYWVAHYRTLTEGSAQQAHLVKDSRPGLVARGTALVAVWFRSIARRSAKKKGGLDGRAKG